MRKVCKEIEVEKSWKDNYKGKQPLFEDSKNKNMF